MWYVVERSPHPAMDLMPKVTLNADRIPGDPINIGFIGDQEQLFKSMRAIGWQPADPITLESSLKIAESVLLHRPDLQAPVSDLFLWGRKQDFAFEQEVGNSASRRHHVRFWQAAEVDAAGKPLWIGSATFDVRSGRSHRTGQITHHIDADVDAQRDLLISSLNEKGLLLRTYDTPGVGPTQKGYNAGGDRYFTDGLVRVGVLSDASTVSPLATPDAR
jgi:hypothetical protein